ncbi:D-aminopeptidase [Azorhizobium caulinodans ORS 571]|uniref:D-aminopeptidase n=1 Tax=Azorhizobium caulinodans (strain ATCC 43989 / DSM 5975 / JCM 20966 / LMG 6465 / NBRC 14845 / NCIMB 13405 / ORS 571) TaxID=438753 RepID=A8IDT7_AZOC5|nr:M55 family metallopeptidase [Azorhizobium caulinodans]BAF88989.1 D-aminopeptidase [Azorhizobium caulinodans ORS 571]
MKVYISADIEGVAGVVSPQQGQPGNAEYERARRLMTEEVNAAIAGAFEGGATEVLVNDSHGPMSNIIPELLDPRADLILGKPKPFNMAAGLTRDFAAVFLVGHHAAASNFGVLAHTTNSFAFREVRLAGRALGEPGIYGAYAGQLGVPVALVTGDDRLVEEARDLFPQAEAVCVKTALSNRAARQMAVEKARAAIAAGARQALANLRAMRPFTIPGPFVAEFVMNSPALADQGAVLPPARRQDATTLAFACADAAEAVGWMTALSAMSAVLR